MHFEIVGQVSGLDTIARGHGIRRLGVLVKRHGGRNWRKRKGVASVRLFDGRFDSPKHWYEAHGVGKTGWKIKCFLD